VSLLPNKTNITSGTHKPRWRGNIPEGDCKVVKRGEYDKQVLFCPNLSFISSSDFRASFFNAHSVF
jgi:hypothetical protein